MVISIRPISAGRSDNLLVRGSGVVTDEQREWYTNKDLYEMMVELSKGLEATNAEMAVTQAMIKEYNGLRARLDQCDQKFAELAGQKTGGKDTWGYVVGGFGLLMAIVSMAVR